jgi:hypothetical protein
MASLPGMAKNKMQNAPSAMTATQKMQMPSFFAMAATWPCIRNAMEYLISLRANGCAANVN